MIKQICLKCNALHPDMSVESVRFSRGSLALQSHLIKKQITRIPGIAGVAETRPEMEDGEEWFALQPEATQLAVLGPGKLEAYREGRIALADLVGHRVDERWGPERFERSLERAEMARERMAAARQVTMTVAQSFAPARGATDYARHLGEVINEVHGIEGMTRITIHRKKLPDDIDGLWDFYAKSVTVAKHAPNPLTTGIHEIGHALDALFLNAASGYGSLQRPSTEYATEHAYVHNRGVLVDWSHLVSRTRPVQEFLKAIRASPYGSAARDLAEYYFLPVEVW
jgi:hypothetical protein